MDIQARNECEDLVDNWLMSDFFEPTRVETLDWLADNDFAQIKARLNPAKAKLVFGTAGLRAKMGPGYDRMNCLTVLQTTQGLVRYLKSENLVSSASVAVIGFDGRHNSENFAHVVASVFLANGIKIIFLDRPCPTPFTPFLVHHNEQALCGIQITASHNPKEDNGYKLFWSNGAQIIPPIDAGVAEAIEKSRAVDREIFRFLDPVTCRMRTPCDPSVLANALLDYIKIIKGDVMCNREETNRGSSVKFAYTAMHGVGFAYFKHLFSAFGFNAEETNLTAVASQVEIDPEFSTVKFPNPEEKGSLKIAIAYAEKHDCLYVLANDPDADRFTACELQRDGSWYQFSGDELGLLFADWQSSNRRKSNNHQGLVLSSVVSSRMVQALCVARNIQFGDCLTGFKWIANESIRLRKENSSLVHLLGFEEAIGFQLSASVPDKDGISAACAFAEMAVRFDEEGIKLTERLEEIYKSEIGFFANINGYFIVDDPGVTKKIFADFRRSGMKKLGSLAIKSVRDITNGIDTSLADGTKSHLPATPEAEMITIVFENGAVVTVRASGTEPKVKFYSELTSKESREAAKTALQLVVDLVKKDFFKPTEYPMRDQPTL